MSLFFGRGRAGSGAEQRAISFQDVFGTGGNIDFFGAGVAGALQLIPLYAAHRTIIDAVAATPLHGYQMRTDGTTQRMAVQPDLLTTQPFGTAFTWKAQCIASLLSDGNAFGLVTSEMAGWPSSLMWLNPYRVTVDDGASIPRYYYEGREVDRQSLVHIPWILPPGKLRGISPIKAFRVALEMGQAAQTMGRDWFANGAIPSGHLKSTGALDPGKASEVKVRFKAAVEGRDVFVSGSDWDYATIGVPADEARFIETLKLSATQIASIYGIPPEEIGGDTGSTSLTYQTLESNELRFAARVIRPWAVRIEEALSQLLPKPVYAKFNLDANVRADLRTRMEAHEIAQRSGLETNPEARRLEDRPPLTEQERAEWLALWRTPGQQTPPAPSTREQA